MAALFAVVLISALIFGLALLWLEARHRLRPASPLRLSSSGWKVQRENDEALVVRGTVRISNPHRRMEVFVTEIELKPTLLGRGDLSAITIQSSLTPQHPDEEARADGYWFAYIVKGHKSTQAEVEIRIQGPQGSDLRNLLDTLWLEILWINYGPFGRLQQRDGVLIPLRRPAPASPSTA
ncbi:MAG: F420-0:Gamma-glutamyl ligase, partial [Vulcanococcus sp.]